MAKKHFWGSIQDFEKRSKQEFLETASGEKKSFFESQDSYERWWTTKLYQWRDLKFTLSFCDVKNLLYCIMLSCG